MDDSTKIEMGEYFGELFTKALHASSQSSDIGIVLGSLLLGALVSLGVAYLASKLYISKRDKYEGESLARETDLRKELSSKEIAFKQELAAKEATFKQEARDEKERSERLVRESQERDATFARERSRLDQSDRESAREKLLAHVSSAIDKLQGWLMPLVERMEDSIRALQGKSESLSGDIVSIREEIKYLKERIEKQERKNGN